YLRAGSVIPQSHTALPVSAQDLLVNVDRLMRSVPRKDLHTLVTQLGTAFAETGPDLRRLLDSTRLLEQTAHQNLPQTVRLFPGNGSTRFGVPIPPTEDHQPCKQGYLDPRKRRLPNALRYPPIRWQSFCSAPTKADVNVRGSREAPEPTGGRLGDYSAYRHG